MLKYPRWFSREKRGKYPHRRFSFISPEFLQGHMRKFPRDDPLKFSHFSMWKSGERGWLARWVVTLYDNGISSRLPRTVINLLSLIHDKIFGCSFFCKSFHVVAEKGLKLNWWDSKPARSKRSDIKWLWIVCRIMKHQSCMMFAVLQFTAIVEGCTGYLTHKKQTNITRDEGVTSNSMGRIPHMAPIKTLLLQIFYVMINF